MLRASANERRYLYHGEMKTIKELQKNSPVTDVTIRQRLKAGWTVEAAVETPPNQTTRRPAAYDGTTYIMFTRPIGGVFARMQPTLGKIYRADYHKARKSGKDFYHITLDSGIPLIVYPGEFLEVSGASVNIIQKEAKKNNVQRNCHEQCSV